MGSLSRTSTYWKTLGVVVALLALGAAGLWWHGALPRIPRALVFGVSLVLVGMSGLALVVLLGMGFGPDPDPRGRARPTGGQTVWFTRLGADGDVAVTPGQADVTIGAAADATIRLDGLEPAHARVRVWRDAVDVGRLGRGRVRVGGQDLRRAAWHPLTDGDVLELAGHRLRVNIGWEADPDDPRVGTMVGAHRLVRRIETVAWGTRYETRAGLLDRLDRRALDDAQLAAYETASIAAHRACPTIAEATTMRDTDGTPAVLWAVKVDGLDDTPSSPEQVYRLCARLAPLHAAGLVHGSLDLSHLLPGSPRGRDYLRAIAAAVPEAPGERGPAGPYREPARVRGEPMFPDDDDLRAPEVHAGAAPTARADVYALATFLRMALARSSVGRARGATLLDEPAWAALVRDARDDSPAARPADAGALAREILRAAAQVQPGRPFDGKTFTRCPQCAEALLAEDPPDTIMMDGIGADGRAIGGQHRTYRGECAACGHRSVRDEMIRY